MEFGDAGHLLREGTELRLQRIDRIEQVLLDANQLLQQLELFSVTDRKFVIDCLHHIVQLMHGTTVLRHLVEVKQRILLLPLDGLQLTDQLSH